MSTALQDRRSRATNRRHAQQTTQDAGQPTPAFLVDGSFVGETPWRREARAAIRTGREVWHLDGSPFVLLNRAQVLAS